MGHLQGVAASPAALNRCRLPAGSLLAAVHRPAAAEERAASGRDCAARKGDVIGSVTQGSPQEMGRMPWFEERITGVRLGRQPEEEEEELELDEEEELELL